MKQTQHSKTPKVGTRIGINELLKYLKTNKEAMKNIGCIDLNNMNNQKNNVVETTITKLQFQDLKKVNYLPQNLASIFEINSDNFHKYLHAGVLQTLSYSYSKHADSLKINVSLYSSILVCLKHTFLSQTSQQQILFVTKLLDRLRIESTGTKFNFFEYDKLGWNKVELKTSITNGDSDPNVIKFVSDYLCINIFILDIEQDKVCFAGNAYISHRKNIFLLKHSDDTYEPCFTEQSRTFTSSDIIIKKLLQNSKKIDVYIVTNNFDKNIGFQEVEEDLIKYVGKTKPKKQLEEKTEVNPKIKEVLESKKVKVNSYDDSINAYNEDDDENSECDDTITGDIENVQEFSPKNDMSKWKIFDIMDKDDDYDENNKEVSEKKPTKINKSTNKKNKSSSESPKAKTYKISDIKTTLKLGELQNIAKDLKIDTCDKVGKTKTKNDLFYELKTKLSK